MDKSLHEIERVAGCKRLRSHDLLFALISKQAIGDILDNLGELKGKRHLDVASGTGHLVAAASQQEGCQRRN